MYYRLAPFFLIQFQTVWYRPTREQKYIKIPKKRNSVASPPNFLIVSLNFSNVSLSVVSSTMVLLFGWIKRAIFSCLCNLDKAVVISEFIDTPSIKYRCPLEQSIAISLISVTLLGCRISSYERNCVSINVQDSRSTSEFQNCIPNVKMLPRKIPIMSIPMTKKRGTESFFTLHSPLPFYKKQSTFCG